MSGTALQAGRLGQNSLRMSDLLSILPTCSLLESGPSFQIRANSLTPRPFPLRPPSGRAAMDQGPTERRKYAPRSFSAIMLPRVVY